MVMVVGNAVVGDSRVEKAARSAQQAGYRVTVLGLIHRTVPALGLIDEVPVVRVAPSYTLHKRWLAARQDAQLILDQEAIDSTRRLRTLRLRAGEQRRIPFLSALVGTSRRRFEDARLALRRTAASIRLASSYAQARLPIRGIWRRAWPQIADLELAFADAIVDLQPDIIHVHDRHILPAAKTAAGIIRRSGRAVKWVYDAHEWLPGVEFAGPKAHAAAWLAAEAELIGHADAVITVSDELASMLAERHNLRTTPSVVTNSPPAASLTVSDMSRTSVREDCGLDSETDLLVYVGSIAKVRGVETTVSALPALSGVHLALVAPNDPKRRQELTAFAEGLGVSERLHILDYVPAQSVPSYISSASIGVSPVEPIANYQYSLATKIREYLHARIPIVASSLQTLARFLEETGVGAVHAPGDPEDCARVIKEVLENRASYVHSITDELLSEHSWERQESILVDVWRGLMNDQVLPTPHPPMSRPRLVMGPPVDAARTKQLISAVCGLTKGTGTLIDRSAISQPGQLAMNVSEFRRLVAESDGIILEALGTLFGNLFRTPEAQLHYLATFRPVAVMLDTIAGVDLDELEETIPDFWSKSLSVQARERILRQSRTTRRLVQAAEVSVLATSPFPMRTFEQVRWVPTVVDVLPRQPPHDGPLRVMVAPLPRAGVDASVVDGISAAELPGIEVHLPASTGSALSLLPDIDVLIDSLGFGSYTDLAARAMGAGCVVITRLDPQVRSALPAGIPVLDATPESVPELVVDLAGDPDRLDEVRSKTVSYARNIHDGRLSARVVATTLGWTNWEGS